VCGGRSRVTGREKNKTDRSDFTHNSLRLGKLMFEESPQLAEKLE
jgi:hypothetical protein